MTENPEHQSKEREVADRLDARTRFAFLLGALFSVEVVLLALRPCLSTRGLRVRSPTNTGNHALGSEKRSGRTSQTRLS